MMLAPARPTRSVRRGSKYPRDAEHRRVRNESAGRASCSLLLRPLGQPPDRHRRRLPACVAIAGTRSSGVRRRLTRGPDSRGSRGATEWVDTSTVMAGLAAAIWRADQASLPRYEEPSTRTECRERRGHDEPLTGGGTRLEYRLVSVFRVDVDGYITKLVEPVDVFPFGHLAGSQPAEANARPGARVAADLVRILNSRNTGVLQVSCVPKPSASDAPRHRGPFPTCKGDTKAVRLERTGDDAGDDEHHAWVGRRHRENGDRVSTSRRRRQVMRPARLTMTEADPRGVCGCGACSVDLVVGQRRAQDGVDRVSCVSPEETRWRFAFRRCRKWV